MSSAWRNAASASLDAPLNLVLVAQTAVSIGQFRPISGDLGLLPRQRVPERRRRLELTFEIGQALFVEENVALALGAPGPKQSR